MDLEVIIERAIEKGISLAFEQKLPAILASFLPHKEDPVTAEEICKYAGISDNTLRKYRLQGKIPFIKLGKSIRYIKSDVVSALTKHQLV